MTLNNSPDIRISLPQGTVLSGTRGSYTVSSLITLSDRSLTVRADGSDGKTYQLKFYNGKHSIALDVLRKIQTVQTQGAVLPADTGMYSNMPFAVYPQANLPDTGKLTIAQNVLVKRIIPQMAWVINQFHNSGILLRDICPEHILYNVQTQRIAYTGFSNAALLGDKATVTKAPGYGQKDCFIAPEVSQYGYSRFSDYYSLGVTLLSLVKGKNPLEGMSASQIYQNLKKGIVPGIDVAHLRNTPYEFYTEEDKIHYLILGLMLPDPAQRWEFGEIQVWCNNKQIPLVRPGGRIRYQYNEPFTIGQYNCWNYQQLTQTLAADASSWNDATFSRLQKFAAKQNIPGAGVLEDMKKDTSMDGAGRIFTCIYLMNPALDGLWWRGRKYKDTNALIRDAGGNTAAASALSELLKNGRMSFFLERRAVVSKVSQDDIREFRQMENWEKQEPGKGVSRAVMRFASSASSRSFHVAGKEYTSFDELVQAYTYNGLRLKSAAPDLLKDQEVQAWLWANGLDEAAKKAALTSAADPSQAFYLLMSIAEKCAKDERGKQAARDMYLRYGEFAPVWWLVRNIQSYKPVSLSDTVIFDTLSRPGFTLSDPLERISSKILALVPEYHHFTDGTAENAMAVECVDLQYAKFSFYPLREDFYFCCEWENWQDVTPAFLRSVGLKPEKKTLDQWILKSQREVDSTLTNIINALPAATSNTPDEKKYMQTCRSNMLASAAMLILAGVFLIVIPHVFVIGLAGFALAVLFPAAMYIVYSSRRTKAAAYYRFLSEAENQRQYYRQIQDGLPRLAADIVSGIMNGNSHPVKLFEPIAQKTYKTRPQEPAFIRRFTGGQKALALLSGMGFIALTYMGSTIFYSAVNLLAVAGSVIVFDINSFTKWSGITLAALAPILYHFFVGGGIMTFVVEVIAGFAVMYIASKD